MLDKVIERFEFAVTLVLLLLIALIVVASVVELARIMILEFLDGPVYVFELQDIIGFLGFFLVVLITLELMRSVWMYVKDHTIHIKVMLEIAIIAVTRKIILLEPGSDPLYLLGIAALVISLAGGYYVMAKKLPG